MNSVVSFIIVLGGLIFIHELGHFLTAKLFRIKVLKFSLGFGPKLLAKTYGETEYIISAFPLGGYVKMLGEQPGETVSAEDQHRSFSRKTVWQRFLVVLAGPLYNLLFAAVIFFVLVLAMGVPEPVPGTEIGVVTPESPAEKAGIKPGDVIISINGQETREWQDISTIIRSSEGGQVSLTLKRAQAFIEVTGVPEISEVKNLFGEVVETRYLLGISKKDEFVYKKVSVFAALVSAIDQTWFYIQLTIMTLVKIFQKIIPASELGGPILIAQMAGQQFEAGWLNLLSFMGLLSINLGVINLFPIPILDGGHLVFFSVEALRRRPISLRTQEIMQQIGIVLLGTLMIFVFYNDFVRIFSE